MATIDTRIETVLAAIVARLQSKLTLSEATCYLGDPDEPPKNPNPKTVHLVVGTSGGTFDEGMWDGGGINQLVPTVQLAIGIFTHVSLDQWGHDKKRQTDSALGLFPMMHSVLDALTNEGGSIWVPVDGSSNVLVREPLQPLGWDGPGKAGDRLGWLKVRFGMLIDWDF